ncbi:MAG: hypothetical protein QXN55_08770 [Candidatus Nitrosotenuis sp.]
MSTVKIDGSSSKLRGPDGYCLDCKLPPELKETRIIADDIIEIANKLANELLELKARIDIVAKNNDSLALIVNRSIESQQKTTEKIEAIACAIEAHFESLSTQIGRIGTRKRG